MASVVIASDKVNLIIDTDAGFDVDDVGALAVALHLEKMGKANILATIHATGCKSGIAAVNVINTYYGRGDIPLGAYKGPFGADCSSQNLYLDDIIKKFPNGGITSSDQVDEAVTAYEKVLSAQPDGSVTMAMIGFPMNLRNLLEKNKALFEKKVKAVYYMNGNYNFGCADY